MRANIEFPADTRDMVSYILLMSIEPTIRNDVLASVDADVDKSASAHVQLVDVGDYDHIKTSRESLLTYQEKKLKECLAKMDPLLWLGILLLMLQK